MVKLYWLFFLYEDTPKSKDNTATDSQIFIIILPLAAGLWLLNQRLTTLPSLKFSPFTFAKASANKDAKAFIFAKATMNKDDEQSRLKMQK